MLRASAGVMLSAYKFVENDNIMQRQVAIILIAKRLFLFVGLLTCIQDTNFFVSKSLIISFWKLIFLICENVFVIFLNISSFFDKYLLYT